MVKTLVLIRHGAPEAASASGTDFDRRLTPSGAHSLEVAYPRTLSLLSDATGLALWSSPAVRALETAEVVARCVEAPGIEVRDALYAQDVPAFLAELEASEARSVIAVGHAPFMDLLATRFLGAGGCPAFDKGAVAAIELPEGPSGAGRLRWFVAGPDTGSWEDLGSVEQAVADAAAELAERATAFLDAPEDAEALRALRISLRRVRSLLQFLAPWQAKKQNRRSERVLKGLQAASARLRALDILMRTVDELVEDGELGENSLLPMACAKERSLECASFVTLMRKRSTGKALARLADDLAHLGWKAKVGARGLVAEDFRVHFDEELAKVDDDLFGLDLRDGNAVYAARRDAKEMHYVAERLGAVLGVERAQMSEYMDEIQAELGALSDARGNRRLAEECARSPRFRGVRADLGVVARDQAEVVSAITSGLERLETGGRAAGAPEPGEVVADGEPTDEPAQVTAGAERDGGR